MVDDGHFLFRFLFLLPFTPRLIHCTDGFLPAVRSLSASNSVFFVQLTCVSPLNNPRLSNHFFLVHTTANRPLYQYKNLMFDVILLIFRLYIR